MFSPLSERRIITMLKSPADQSAVEHAAQGLGTVYRCADFRDFLDQTSGDDVCGAIYEAGEWATASPEVIRRELLRTAPSCPILARWSLDNQSAARELAEFAHGRVDLQISVRDCNSIGAGTRALLRGARPESPTALMFRATHLDVGSDDVAERVVFGLLSLADKRRTLGGMIGLLGLRDYQLQRILEHNNLQRPKRIHGWGVTLTALWRGCELGWANSEVAQAAGCATVDDLRRYAVRHTGKSLSAWRAQGFGNALSAFESWMYDGRRQT